MYPVVRQLVFLFLLLCLLLPASAQSEQIRFSPLELPEELSHIDYIYEDHLGFLWLGCYSGLYRYDGYELVHFANDPGDPNSIQDHKIKCMVEDQWNNLVIGTQDGIHYLDRISMTFTPIPIIRSNVFHINKMSDGTLWATGTAGVYKLSPQDSVGAYTIEQILDKDMGRAELASDKVLFTGNGTELYMHTDQENLKLDGIFDNPDFHGQYVVQMARDTDSTLWLLSEEGIYLYDFYRQSLIHYHPWKLPFDIYFIYTLKRVRKDLILITAPGGLYEYDAERRTLRENGINKNYPIVRDVSRIFNGQLYNATRSNIILEINETTLWKYDPTKSIFKFIPTSIRQENPLPGAFSELLEIHPGKLLIEGTKGPEVFNLYSEETSPFSPLLSIPEQQRPLVLTTFAEHGDNLWVGSDHGVWYFERNKRKFTHIDDLFGRSHFKETHITRHLKLDSRNNLWIASWQTEPLYRLNLRDTTYYVYDPMPASPAVDFPEMSFRHIFEDRDDKIWIGSRNGLLQWREEVDSFQRYVHDPEVPTSMSENTSFCIYQDTLGYIWCGSYGGGLNRMDTGTGQFIHFTENDGLLNNNIFSLLPDSKGNLWMMSFDGITRFNPYTFDILNLTHENGLGNKRFDGFSYGQSPYTGEFFFLGYDGIDIFHPDSVRLSDFEPPIVFTDFELFNQLVPIRSSPSATTDQFLLEQDIALSNKITLDYDDRVFTIHYAALDFSGPGNITYAYQLEGFDEDWQYVDQQRSATYTNLDPGSYAFRVKSTNADGVWSNRMATLSIQVTPPWWSTSWAYVVYSLTIAGILYLIYRYQRRRWQLQTALQIQEQEALRLREMDTVKSNLYTNITHEFRTPLTVINGMIEQIRTHPRQWLQEGLTTIEQQSQKLLDMVNQILDLQKVAAGGMDYHPQLGDIITHINFLAEPFQFQAASKGLEMHIRHHHEALQMDFDQDKLDTIVSNLLSNALKYTEDGFVTLTTDQVDNDFVLTVEDTGRGIAPEHLKHIFDRFYQSEQGHTRRGEGTGIGLALVHEILPLMQGTIKVKSVPGQGSRFQVSLRITRQAPRWNAPVRPQVQDADATKLEDTNATVPTISSNKAKALILIIEDNQDVRKYLHAMLGDRYQVEEAENGDTGIIRAKSLIPDLIISDVMMPHRDGYEVCKALHADELTMHIPIILLTAKADDPARITGYQRGADAYITKPFQGPELEAQIAMLLKQRQRLQVSFRKQLQEDQEASAAPAIDPFIDRLQTFILEQLSDDTLGIPEICTRMQVSRSQMHQKIKGTTGLSTSIFIRKIRLREARKLIRSTDLQMAEIAYRVGFKDPNYFSRVYRDEYGETPLEGRS